MKLKEQTCFQLPIHKSSFPFQLAGQHQRLSLSALDFSAAIEKTQLSLTLSLSLSELTVQQTEHC